MSYSAEVLNELAPKAREMLEIPKDHYTGLIVGFGYSEIQYLRGTSIHRLFEESNEAVIKDYI